MTPQLTNQQLKAAYDAAPKYGDVAILAIYNKSKKPKDFRDQRFIGIKKYPGGSYKGMDYFLDSFMYDTQKFFLYPARPARLSLDVMGHGQFGHFGLGTYPPHFKVKQYNYYFDRVVTSPMTERTLTPGELQIIRDLNTGYLSSKADFTNTKLIA